MNFLKFNSYYKYYLTFFFYFFRLLVLKIDYIYKKLKESANTRAKYRKKSLSDLLPMVLKTVHRRWFSNRTIRYLRQFITRQKNSYEMNVMKVCLLYFLLFIKVIHWLQSNFISCDFSITEINDEIFSQITTLCYFIHIHQYYIYIISTEFGSVTKPGCFIIESNDKLLNLKNL